MRAEIGASATKGHEVSILQQMNSLACEARLEEKWLIFIN